MKKVNQSLLFALIVMGSTFSSRAYAENAKLYIPTSEVSPIDLRNDIIGLKPSDETSELKVDIPYLNSLSLHVVCNIEVVQDFQSTPYIMVSGPKNYVNLLKFISHDGSFIVKFKDNTTLRKSGLLKVKIVINDLHSLSNNGVGNVVFVNEMNFDKLFLANNGVGNMQLKSKLEVNFFELQNNGVGGIYIHSLKTDSIIAKNKGVGSISIIGKAVSAELQNIGVGSMHLKEFKVDRLTVINKGVGSVSCYGAKTAILHSYGVGSVTMYGDAKLMDMIDKGIGGGIKIRR